MIKLTEEILQSCFKQKTIYRNSEWDVIWELGGKNAVTIGEKSGKFYLLEFQTHSSKTPIVDLLPSGFVQADAREVNLQLVPIATIQDLEKYFPEISNYFKQGKVR